jgi:hypothetical protein
MQRHCEDCMHRDNKDYKNAKGRRERGCHCAGGLKCEQGGKAQE